MTWGILVFESKGLVYRQVSSLVMADDSFYEGMREELSRGGMRILGGRKGISDEKIDSLASYVNRLVKRLNKREQLDVEKELSGYDLQPV